MYASRLRTLTRAYSSARRNNELYKNAKAENALQRLQLNFLTGLFEQLKVFGLRTTEKESEWRQSVLSILEAEIAEYLSFVYPDDGYFVKLNPRVLRGKIHIEAEVFSAIMQKIPGQINKTQGRLFQQIVSFAALFSTMALLGLNTVYMDEAFSGSSMRNVKKLNILLQHVKEKGFNAVIIAQNTSMADGLDWNRLILTRSLDNKTTVEQKEV